MKLNEKYYNKMKSGIKTIEIRLCDEKRQKIKIGDTIEFTKLSDKSETLQLKVVDLLKYPKFSNLVNDLDMKYFGYPSDYDKNKYINSYYEIYTLEQEEKYGVLGIRFSFN